MNKRPTEPTAVNDYLWDRRGSPDGQVVELEDLLARYRRPAPPAERRAPAAETSGVIDPATEMGRGWYWAAAAMVAAVLIGAGLYYLEARRGREWTVTDARGTERLARGESVTTSAGRTLRLSSPTIGEVEVGENTTLRLLEARSGRSTLELTIGTIHARTTSPPGVFVVETPRARAVDLGCEYTLRVDAGRGGRLHVDSGWVALVRGWRQSLVPERASAIFDEEGRLTPPWFDDAHPDFGAALRSFSIPQAGAAARARALDTILALARARDGLTLLNMFSIAATPEERLRIFDRLNALVPAPPGVSRDGAASGSIGATEEWWAPVRKAAGVGPPKKGKKSEPSA
jgi:hypothetical protein